MISKELLKKIIIEQQELSPKKYILREKLKKLNEKSISDSIVIVTGIRRSGKSYLLNIFRNKQTNKNYYINFDDDRLISFSVEDFEILYEVFLELFDKESIFYFDEIQNVKGWERFIRRLHDYSNKIYITGSNSNLLSKELGTHLTGRYVSIELFPASFKEYLIFHGFEYSKENLLKREYNAKIKKLFSQYLKEGGFLKYLQDKDREFFKTLMDSIIYRDIVSRYNLPSDKPIKEVVNFLFSNISKEFSYTTIKNITQVSNVTTIKDYISYLENSYLLFTLTLYDTSLKKQLINPKKAYAIDHGLANTMSFKFSEDADRILENIIFIELKRQGKEIYYHRKKKECDFVIKEGLEITTAIQVTQYMENIETREREISGLLDALNSYNLKEGLILTQYEEGEEVIDNKKIIIKPIWKWLLEE